MPAKTTMARPLAVIAVAFALTGCGFLGWLDVEDAIHGSYDLEVSSPGVNRILRDCKDFRVHKGEIAKVKMSEAQDGRRNFKGRIKSCDERVLSLEVDGRDVSLPLSEIDRANLEYEF